MKHIKLFISATLIATTAFLFSCGGAEEKKDDKKDTTKTEVIKKDNVKDTLTSDTTTRTNEKIDKNKAKYACPSCGKTSDKAGTCPDCDMEYIENVD